MCIPNQNYLINALDIVLGWNISDELLPLALIDQAKLMAGFENEDISNTENEWELAPESYVAFQ